MEKKPAPTRKAPAKRTRTAKQVSAQPKRFKLNLLPRQVIGLVLLFVIVTSLSWLLINKTTQAKQQPNRLQVVTTFYPLYFFAEQIGGQLADVANLTPAGADAHDYEPTPIDLTKAYTAPLFIYNNGLMEPWVSKFLTDYRHTSIEISHSLSDLDHHENEGDPAHHEDTNNHQPGHAHDHTNDPHTWTDPVLAQDIILIMVDGFSQADPSNASTYRINGQNLIQRLASLDQEYRQGLSQCQKRTIITSHAAFSHLADRYHIEVLPISGLSPEQEPSAAKLAELKQIMTSKNIDVVFFEHQASPQLAQTLASEASAKLAILDPIESLSATTIDQKGDYFTVQRSNLANLQSALSCR